MRARLPADGVGTRSLLSRFYKVQFQLDDAAGRSVMYVHAGRMLGGNSAFAHIGTYQEIDDDVIVEVRTLRHHSDPNYRPLLGIDEATVLVRAKASDGALHFNGTLREFPGSVFQAVMTPIDDELPPAIDLAGKGCVVNGLYSIRIRMLDGIDGDLTGVMLLNDGRILGGDAFFYYIGSYTSANGRWKGQILNQEHAPAKGEYPIFGGHEVGIGFSGSCDAQSARLDATALAGKRSLRLSADLKLILPVSGS
jgi:T3SS negative regulator,GrlR